MYEDELYHYGKLGMKWGVRKSRPKSSGSSNRSIKKKKINTAKKQKILTDARKQKLKSIAKTSAIVVGKTAVTLGMIAIGGAAYSEVRKHLQYSGSLKAMSDYTRDYNNSVANRVVNTVTYGNANNRSAIKLHNNSFKELSGPIELPFDPKKYHR